MNHASAPDAIRALSAVLWAQDFHRGVRGDYIRSGARVPPGRQEGERWRPEHGHESRQALFERPNPVGNRTRWVDSSGVEDAGWVRGSIGSSRDGGTR